tara:strand:+ start:1786 stop:2334 length:549 start_codon:yes stop_codon:yes gene_type:complete
MKRILIFGSNSDLAKKTKLLINKNKYSLKEYSKKKINFSKKISSKKISKILIKENPDIILNFSSVLGTNNDDYRDVYNVNFLPNWEIIKYYLKTITKKKVKIIFIGSSSYKKGKANYMLYTSSKAALHNLYQAAKEKFKNSNIKIKIFHPPRFKSKLLKSLKNKGNVKNINIIAKDLLKKIG